MAGFKPLTSWTASRRYNQSAMLSPPKNMRFSSVIFSGEIETTYYCGLIFYFYEAGSCFSCSSYWKQQNIQQNLNRCKCYLNSPKYNEVALQGGRGSVGGGGTCFENLWHFHFLLWVETLQLSWLLWMKQKEPLTKVVKTNSKLLTFLSQS